MTTAIFNADAFRVLHAYFASTEGTRYYLNGVSIEAHPLGGVVMVATDGHVLGAYHDPHGRIQGEKIIVRLDKTALAQCKSKRSEQRYLSVDENAADVISTPDDVNWNDNAGDDIGTADFDKLATWPNALVDGTFPEWTRVLPAFNRCGVACGSYSTRLIERLAKAFADLNFATNGNRNHPMTIYAECATSPALVKGACADRFFAVIMPMRGNESTAHELPSWYQDMSQAPVTQSAE